MKSNGICPNCGNQLIYEHDESTETYTCPFCGWSVATSYIAPIDQDKQQYKIYINKNENPSIEQIKVVSPILNNNFVETKHKLVENNILVFKGVAAEILPIKQKLDASKIDYFIQPSFNYD